MSEKIQIPISPPLYANGREVEEMHWEGDDLHIKYKDGNVIKYVNAFMSNYDTGSFSPSDGEIQVTKHVLKYSK